jgi:hypothetical protein
MAQRSPGSGGGAAVHIADDCVRWCTGTAAAMPLKLAALQYVRQSGSGQEVQPLEPLEH